MGSGKVDYDNVWKNLQAMQRHIRWRALRSLTNGVRIVIFGYVTNQGKGPWFGYTKEMLKDAPCTHCGRVEVFGPAPDWAHECPGIYQGKTLPCEGPHPCRGEPSMATAPLWSTQHWIEVSLL